MTDFIAVAFDSTSEAFDVREQLIEMQAEYLITLDDAVITTKESNGKIKLHQATNLTAIGAASGSMWGMLIGMLFLNPLAGALVGAGTGAVSGALSDVGISDDMMRDISASFKEDQAILFILVRNATTDKVLERLEGNKGRIVRSSLSKDKEDEIRQAFESANIAADVDKSIEVVAPEPA